MTGTRSDTALFCISACSFLFSFTGAAQGIPAAGQDTRIEICNWNLEWFGKTTPGYGPANDLLQQKNIYEVIRQADIDIWAFSEIADTRAFDSMLMKLPGYASTVSPYLPEQKTALIYRTDQYRLAGSKLIGKANKDSFSTGRFPYEVALVPLNTSSIDTLFIILLHLKSNIGSEAEKQAAYNSRKRSSEWLRMYLSKTHKNHFCMVTGDWNDDLDASIYNNLPSPFTDLLQTGFPFTFLTLPLSAANVGTTTAYTNPIDHQLVSSRLKKLYLQDSTFVWHIDRYIPNYAQSTSDHYPVYSCFSTHSSGLGNIDHSVKPGIHPSPADQSFSIPAKSPAYLEILSAEGRSLRVVRDYQGENIDISFMNDGLYIVSILSGFNQQFYPLLIRH